MARKKTTKNEITAAALTTLATLARQTIKTLRRLQ